ncbi:MULTISPECIES: 23S rRNA (uracil(747)-C(5))-methyltransferase RlmC [unclassified Arsukibacterium]|uniref:23S rRNA (uracil(747)-C(5))-methyltransferase RlmC n=1 Tax=unclassified Arsukibacterium TaxID=2635278 RepID=UPI000C969204|nr:MULTISPECIES: 23S rRNA (uracil(747)-C(5))-methyltransferase RlmC [unclassified Arsukibacterium]MAA95481.1 23S rRNA (uracil(747)-C(5))-methyltransferase RlmC [Rheinheimera sp.]HAW94381.1 23S rRNA (uracil(747)-C(5))-methyltransferase RlmC [Candidatus Azambacteria bacterium]|tara:strand:+ start:19803 stop:20948 length:1146 start_codon:yes stop_codon:yes gene_type:complete
MNCHHFQANRCQSCQWLAKPYLQQLADKQQHLTDLLAPLQPAQILAPQASEQQGFRYKAKMVVLGTVAAPILGIINARGEQVDLADCPLYPASFAPVLSLCKAFISRADLTPYNIASRLGELKYILLSQSLHSGRFMLRLVLRSKNCLAAIIKHLPWLLQQLPELEICSVNLQPLAAAILEGPEEIVLTKQMVLAEQLNQVPLYLQPQSFFQTQPVMAASLYQTAAKWLSELQQQQGQFSQIWDLFCGVGGFGLHLVKPDQSLTGIEIAPAAIASAKRSAAEMGLKNVSFQALDATAFASAAAKAPDLLVVNPPRRGLGLALCQDIERLAPGWLVYSSCNAQTLAEDLIRLKQYKLLKVQLFDMFAHSSHYEILTLLQRKY